MITTARQIATATFRALASFGLTIALVLLLLLLTYLGTLAQVEHGLYEAQKRYFDAPFTIHWIADTIPVPLPGAYTILALLSVNLILGGFIRLRWRRAVIGVGIVHAGILLLILAGFVKFHYAREGTLTVREGGVANEVEHHYEWELTAVPTDAPPAAGARTSEWRADLSGMRELGFGESPVVIDAPALPFIVEVQAWYPNADVLPKGPRFEVDVPVIDGYFLRARPRELAAETNRAGAYLTVIDRATGARQAGLVSGLDLYPWTISAGGQTWTLCLGKRRFSLPFMVRLDRFERELHPGITMARSFASEITRVQNGEETMVRISMNKPLRHEGYTLFQSSYFPENPGPGQRFHSVFAVVENPSDHWPLYACIVIAVGLIWHFGAKLVAYLQRSARRRTTAAWAPPSLAEVPA